MMASTSHPYRTAPPAESASPARACAHRCLRCAANTTLTHVPRRTLVLGAAAAAFVILNLASALVALSCMRLTQQMLAAASSLDDTTTARARTGEGHVHPSKSHGKASPPKAAPAPPPEAHAKATTPQPTIPAAPTAAFFPTSWHFEAPHTVERGIVKIAPDERIVDRAVLDGTLALAADRLTPTRIWPEKKDGKVIGVAIYGIDHESVLGLLGLQNGDTLQTVNGWDLASPEKALEAYSRVGSSNELVIGLERKGGPVFLRYHIR